MLGWVWRSVQPTRGYTSRSVVGGMFLLTNYLSRQSLRVLATLAIALTAVVSAGGLVLRAARSPVQEQTPHARDRAASAAHG